MMMRPGDILGRIFFILSQKSIIGSSEFRRMLNGYYFEVACRQDVLEEIRIKNC